MVLALSAMSTGCIRHAVSVEFPLLRDVGEGTGFRDVKGVVHRIEPQRSSFIFVVNTGWDGPPGQRTGSVPTLRIEIR